MTRTRALVAACAVLALTSVHHVYGAIHYAAPWRYQAVHVSGVILVVLLGAHGLGRAKSGTSAGWMTSLFPPPTYEMPNNLIFETTGILQVRPAVVAARALWGTP